MSADLEARLSEVERRLDRVERLAFLAFQDLRDVASYAYENVRLDVSPEEVKRLPGSFARLSDKEILAVGVNLHELVALKSTMRVLRKQVRLDVLGVVRDLLRRGQRAQLRSKDAA